MITRLLNVRRSRDEGGFALIFVLLVTTVVTMGVLATLTTVTRNIGASRNSEDSMSALAAARSGVDDLIAYLVAIPSCRSETKVCPQALGASSAALTGVKKRPVLGTGQTFSWTTNPAVTTDGYVRVTATGTSNGTTRKVVADLSLQPSILSYGYYSDYESFAPSFLNSYYNAGRQIYLTDSTIAGNMLDSLQGTLPSYATWAGPSNSSNCGQHWYAEGAASPGRASTANGSKISEDGRVGTTASLKAGVSVTRSSGCDLVFSSAMVQDGKTFSRDALLMSGAGPKFNQAVYTMWGYNDGTTANTSPAPTAGKNYRGDTMTNSPNLPTVATDDLVLPKTIGMDGLAEDACVYTGPTRVKLNGDGTATITSPSTTTKNAASDPDCYPAGSIAGTGVLGYVVNYQTAGSGTVIVRQRGTAPAAGWPANPTRSTNVPSANNEVFAVPATGAQNPVLNTDSSASGVDCADVNGKRYSTTPAAACAWTNLASATDMSATTGPGWASYASSRCNSSLLLVTNRQKFECEYGPQSGTSTPSVSLAGGQYAVVRNNIRAELAKNNCVGGTLAEQAVCISTMTNTQLTPANTTAQRYLATSTVGTPVRTKVSLGSFDMDPFFSTPAPPTETLWNTPITTTVKRQIKTAGNWVNDSNAFSFTTTQSDYIYAAAGSTAYFPNPLDVTAYNTGTDASGGAAGSAGVNQPADLYVDGKNKGKLSLVADNDVILTGNITNPAGYTPATDALSIAAGKNVRNYHPVRCADQTPASINNTSPGWCPNDITGLTGTDNLITSGAYEAAHPAEQYLNMQSPATRNIDAAVFALSGSLRTDNYNRGDAVGFFNINGGVYQSFRGGNGVISGTNQLSGTTLQYKYVDLQRAELPYVPPASSGNYSRPWDVVSISAGPS